MSVRWPIEEQFGDETNYYLSPRVYHAIATRAIAALKEIVVMPHIENHKPLLLTYPSDRRVVVQATTSMSHDARRCGRCRAKRALRMEE